jgi:hypothetical protein
MSGVSGSTVQTSLGTCLQVGMRRAGRASDVAGECHRASGGCLARALSSPDMRETGVCGVMCLIWRGGLAPWL